MTLYIETKLGKIKTLFERHEQGYCAKFYDNVIYGKNIDELVDNIINYFNNL